MLQRTHHRGERRAGGAKALPSLMVFNVTTAVQYRILTFRKLLLGRRVAVGPAVQCTLHRALLRLRPSSPSTSFRS
jgi:hypothetical protein